MLTVDSYYYLEMAKQLQDGTYSTFDERRQVPSGYNQPATPPLLSVLLARISTITGTRLEWVALLLPAFLGALLTFPVYLLTRDLLLRAKGVLREETQGTAAKAAGLAAAFVALLSPMLAGRSSVGWCDTDPLNVALPVLLAWLAMRFSDAESPREQYGFLGGFGLVGLLFLWWWDQSYIPVFALAGIPFVVAVIFVAVRSPKRLLPILLSAGCLLLLVGFWKGFSILNPMKYWDTMQGMMSYIVSDSTNSPFRPAGVAVSEQSATPFPLLMRESCGGVPGFFVACLGVLTLAWLTRAYFLFLTPLLMVAVLSVTGQRFLIFTAPFFGLGVGTIVFLIFQYLKKMSWQLPVTALLLVLASWGAIQAEGRYDKRVPRRYPVLFDAMQVIEQKTEKEGVIWASWGHGHPLLLYGQRAIMADGMFHSDALQYVLNFPWAADNFRLAANWISFYVKNGHQGLSRANTLFGESSSDWAGGMAVLQNLLEVGPAESRTLLAVNGVEDVEKELQWLFPGNVRPVYLFLDYLLPTQAWFTLGRWNLATGTPPRSSPFIPVNNIGKTKDGQINGSSRMGRLLVDVPSGKVIFGKRATQLSSLRIHDGKKLNSRKFTTQSNLEGLFFLPGRKGLLTDQRQMNTVLVKLYYEYTYNRKFFKPLDVRNPYYAIWEVTGEAYQPDSGRE